MLKMAKKKEVVYVPISKDIPNAQQQNLPVPDYNDPGIKYKGYAKISLGEGNYKLKRQATRFYANYMSVGESTKTNNRVNLTTHKFYATGLTISWQTIPGGAYKFLTFYDGNANNSRFVYFLVPNITAVGGVSNGTSSIFIDLSECPRLFNGDIYVTLPANLADGEVVEYILTGFDEEI